MFIKEETEGITKQTKNDYAEISYELLSNMKSNVELLSKKGVGFGGKEQNMMNVLENRIQSDLKHPKADALQWRRRMESELTWI